MTPIDWDELVQLQLRGRSNPDGDLEVVQVAAGSLRDMVIKVFSLRADDRLAVSIEGPLCGCLSIFEIIALSMRADFPSG